VTTQFSHLTRRKFFTTAGFLGGCALGISQPKASQNEATAPSNRRKIPDRNRIKEVRALVVEGRCTDRHDTAKSRGPTRC
jgi:hypothetical protein